MTSPLLYEPGILELLKAPISRQYASALQAGAAQTLIDTFDRKATRDVFLETLEKVLFLYGYTHQLTMLSNTYDVFKSGDLNQTKFDNTNEKLSEKIRDTAMALTEHVKRLQQCPTDEDKVN